MAKKLEAAVVLKVSHYNADFLHSLKTGCAVMVGNRTLNPKP